MERRENLPDGRVTRLLCAGDCCLSVLRKPKPWLDSGRDGLLKLLSLLSEPRRRIGGGGLKLFLAAAAATGGELTLLGDLIVLVAEESCPTDAGRSVFPPRACALDCSCCEGFGAAPLVRIDVRSLGAVSVFFGADVGFSSARCRIE